MAVNLLIARKNGSEEGSFEAGQKDHKFLAAYLPQLEKMAAELKIRGLKDFFDKTGAEYDRYGEKPGEKAKAGGDISLFPDDNARPNRLSAEHSPIRGPENLLDEDRQWFDPAEALVSLEAILKQISRTRPAFFRMGHDEAVIIELKDCLALLQTLKAEEDLFHFSTHIA